MTKHHRGRNGITTLDYALLGLLARRSLSGYDLVQYMKKSIDAFWHAHHSTVYPELARLETEGLVTHTVVQQHDRPDKKVYSLTPAGRERVRQWVTSTLLIPPDRDEFMLRTFSIWLADPQEAAAFYRTHERLRRERMADYEDIRAWWEREHGEQLIQHDTPAFASYATVLRGIEYERGYAEWCRWLAETLEQRASPDLGTIPRGQQ